LAPAPTYSLQLYSLLSANLDFFKLFRVDVAVAVQVEHPESDLELTPEQEKDLEFLFLFWSFSIPGNDDEQI
jgi:hypothetical protein